jgi:hypothetical protein
MSELIWLDAIEVGRQVGVPERTFLPPVPGETHYVTEQSWNKEYLKKAIEKIAPYKQAGGTVVITGHVDAWVVLGLGNSLRPECEIQYGAGLDGPGKPATATKLLQLPMGELNPQLRFVHSMRVEGDNCYLAYQVDDPTRGPGHTFDNDKLPELVLPTIPEGKHLFLYAQACYYVQVNVTNSYAQYAKSVSTAYHDTPVYHCAWSSSPDIEPGDETPFVPLPL